MQSGRVIGLVISFLLCTSILLGIGTLAEAQPARPVLTLRAAAISERDVLRLAVRLPRGYTVSWTRG